MPKHPAQHLQRPALERMPRPGDRHRRRKVPDTSSKSCIPSTAFRMICYSRRLLTTPTSDGSCCTSSGGSRPPCRCPTGPSPRRQLQQLRRQHRLPQRHLIAYSTKHNDLDPFLPNGSRSLSQLRAPTANVMLGTRAATAQYVFTISSEIVRMASYLVEPHHSPTAWPGIKPFEGWDTQPSHCR